MRAVQVDRFGGPEVLSLTELPDPAPRDGLQVLEVSSAGVNFADTHQTDDSYLSRTTLPLVPGSEVVGRMPDGRRVSAFAVSGGYAEKTLVSPQLAFPLPDAVGDGQALSLLVQGLTAWHLLRTCTRLAPGESVVVHAAAGGVGTIAVQLAKAWGAGNIIGVASSAEKRELAMSLGADTTVDAGAPDLEAALKDANGGREVDIVLEMVGGTTFDASLAALAPFGRLATFGTASRTLPKPVTSGELMSRGRAVVGFWLNFCFDRPDLLLQPQMADLLGMVEAGTLAPVVGRTYPLSESRRAHEDLLNRASRGKLVLDCTA